MKRIGLISDTHSYLDPAVFKYFEGCDEIWHAGDIGDPKLSDALSDFRPFRAVYGNIDGRELRQAYPEDLWFECEGVRVLMTHIGGYPGRYSPRVRGLIDELKPQLYICGHSHILKVMPDKKRGLLHVNPGAAGHHGFHQVRTVVRFTLKEARIEGMEVVELGKRGALR
ncbi:metallophosphoesterase family protein [Phaeodactylibacter luteus]|uniref:Phosphoesterase n=1 Tax=Phaeodactylibacter luteus TaxID=1564516 RepID=A0A5C6RXL4_9BACT|nr:metallophosphoesterase family protein [Phaeodactylibacter luteus]TXB66569.1 metallophosphoesterase family protein [Phaeodactylibacter luteus]